MFLLELVPGTLFLKTLDSNRHLAILVETLESVPGADGFQEGKISARKTRIAVKPVETFSSEDIKQIRKSVGLSQIVFASSLGVSKKTVEAWECGRNAPEGPSRRLLQLIRDNPEVIDQYLIKA